MRADILCKNTIDDHYVLIENQLEKTDHTHLGQIMTYAAGLDAVTVIWIAKQFTEEHRATIDWLNRITDQEFNFFGIEIEAFKIGESLPAPLFQIVSKPNDWSRTVKSAAAANQNLSETKSLNLEYWTSMKKYFEEKGTFLKQQKPQPQHWTNFALGKSYFHMAAVSSVRDNFLRVEFLINTNNSKEDFRDLKEKYEKQSYEQICNDLVWDELSDKKVSWVYLKKNAIVSDISDWESQFAWFMKTLENFDKFFRPKIRSI